MRDLVRKHKLSNHLQGVSPRLKTTMSMIALENLKMVVLRNSEATAKRRQRTAVLIQIRNIASKIVMIPARMNRTIMISVTQENKNIL